MMFKKKVPLPTKADFPLLVAQDIAYFDNGATTQKPAVVLAALEDYYEHANANVHRGLYKLAEKSTQAYEEARATVAKHLQCKTEEVVFTSGTTHSMNLAAHILEDFVRTGDEILTTVAEHHSTFVPFQQLATRLGAKLVVVPLVEGTMTEAQINKHITSKTAIIAIAHASNVLGYTLDLGKIKKGKAVLVVDAAQTIAHHNVTLKEADMIAFSAHKMYGPQGIGVFAGKKKYLDQGAPLLFGGSMIHKVTIAQTTWATPPQRYEAGTPNVAGAVGLAAALDFLAPWREEALKQELALTEKAASIVSNYATLLGPKKRSAPILSFVVPSVHAHDVAQVLDSFGVCVRAGQHCCQPLHDSLKVEASVRLSFAVYNTEAELARLEEGLKQVKKVFGK